MIDTKIGYNYNDLTIVPAVISGISSRKECSPYIIGHKLPIFTAPMDTVVNESNYDYWNQNNIFPIYPRNIDAVNRSKDIINSSIVDYIDNGAWVALSLKEFEQLFVTSANMWKADKTYYICIDLANGHMQKLYEVINTAKELSRKYNYVLKVMTGNIANPETYEWICINAEVDYIRCSIGSGAGCTTASNTGTHYPIASLIDECYQIKKDIVSTPMYIRETEGVEEPYVNIPKGQPYKSRPAIIADGGIRNYNDVIKALALGADYVMIGSLLAGLLESAAPLNIECYNSHYKYSFRNDGYINNGIVDILNIWNGKDEYWEIEKRKFIHDMKEVTKEFYGMSTKKAQKQITPSATVFKTSEGCTKTVKVTHTIEQWVENMTDYLKSTMSYCNAFTLNDFIGKQTLKVNSIGEISSVNK